MRRITLALFVIAAALATVAVARELEKEEITHRLEFGVSIGGVDSGTYEIGLFGKTVPKTVENFKSLCTG
jgi:peptidylprolyl isomerase